MYRSKDTELTSRLHRLFGERAVLTPLSSSDRMGRRISGVDLRRDLSVEEAELLIDLLDAYQVITFPDQDQNSFRVAHLERIANHFGAPIPHPKNYANYVEYHTQGIPLQLLPKDQQASSRCNAAFPGDLICVEDADSPAVYIVTNLPGSGAQCEERLVGGLHWHTDIEFEPVPWSTSMFEVLAAPKTRNSANGTWVPNNKRPEGIYHPDSDTE